MQNKLHKFWIGTAVLTALLGVLCFGGCQNTPDENTQDPTTTVTPIVTTPVTPSQSDPTVTPEGTTSSTPDATSALIPEVTNPTGTTAPETVPATDVTTKVPQVDPPVTSLPEAAQTTPAATTTTKPITTTTKKVTTAPKPVTTTKPVTTPPPKPDDGPAVGTSISVRFISSNSKAGSISGSALQNIRYGQTTTTSVTANPALGYKFTGWSDGVKSATRSGESFKENCIITANFEYDAMEFPIISITTETGRDPTSKEDYINGTISISNCDAKYVLNNYEMEIRGRGNYTWTEDKVQKKSWRVKLSKKQNLLGQGDGPAKSWTLIANHCDQSLIRNFTTLNYARQLENIAFMSSAISVDVYVNGEYRGVYSLCEQNQVQEYRVNITESPNSVKTGYLVEMTGYAVDPKFTMYMQSGNFNFEIKNDLSTNSSTYNAQFAFIEDYMRKCWSAVQGGNEAQIRALIDIESVVDTYIVEELFKNLDAGWDSFYMYIDNGIDGDVLHFGPIWDFDLSGGNCDEPTGCDQYTGLRAGTIGCNPWYGKLLEQTWFRKLVAARWKELKGLTDQIPSLIIAEAERGFDAYSRNFEKWKIFGQQINREPAAIRALRTYKEHYEYYARWMQNRIDWLDSYFGSPAYFFDGKLSLSGRGTKTSPYLVTSAEDFLNFTLCMQNGQNFSGKYFRQTADIDMTTIAGYMGVGSSSTFAGIYDGTGHTIRVNLSGGDQCIFPYLTGRIMNLFTTGSISNSAQAGGICRSVRHGGLIVNCGSSMSLSGSYAGGIAPSNQSGGGMIAGCLFIGSVSGNEAASPINCYADGRGGTYEYNYYKEGITHTTMNADPGTPKNETVLAPADMADAMNENLWHIADLYAISESELCSWITVDGVPVMVTK